MKKYLQPGKYINWQHPRVLKKATELALGIEPLHHTRIAESCFKFVRDEIRHSWDYRLNPVTCKASDVLKHGTGYCYAKSHLLAALLRANGIPAGLCYQRLTISGQCPPFCLHGLNAIWLEEHGWYRVDARGNKEGIHAECCPPQEKLAFPVITEGEADLPEIWEEPLPIVVQVLENSETYIDVANNLPDVEIIQTNKKSIYNL